MTTRRENEPSNRTVYYTEYSRKAGSGIVETSPTRVLPELVLTGRNKTDYEVELEAHARMVEEVMGQAAHKGRNLEKTRNFAKLKLFELSLSAPGIVGLKDNYYTGWFYTSEDGQVYSAFRQTENVPSSQYLRDKPFSPFFLFDNQQANTWNERLKENPLTVEKIEELRAFSSINDHPSYGELSKLNLEQLVGKVTSSTDDFWKTFRSIEASDIEGKREFLKSNLLDLSILDIVGRQSYRTALAEIKTSMATNGLTVFPLGTDGSVVGYIVGKGGGMKYRTLPLPHEKIRHFQRYGALNELPMTQSEFIHWYKKLVDPNTHLFDK